jgi:plastocyanin
MGQYFSIGLSVFLLFISFSKSFFEDETVSSTLTNEIKIINGSLYGTVTIPVQSTSTRTFRGSSYRSRGSATSSSSDNDKEGSQYQNTIVSAHPISFSLGDKMKGDPASIQQINATFIPNVTPVTVGSVVQFVNDDPFYHNVFSLTPGSKFNIGRRETGDVYTKQIEAPKWKVTGVGPITLFCDIHSQMKATILSLDTIYYTRLNDDGTYQLGDLPEGEYEIRVFSPGFDIISKPMTIKSSENIQSNFNLGN